MISEQIYINKGVFIDSKPGKISARYKMLKEVKALVNLVGKRYFWGSV
jgi:hypothetical protein